MIRVGFFPARLNGVIRLASDAIISCANELRECGIDLRYEASEDVDVLWVNWADLKDNTKGQLMSGMPLIVDEERDACQVVWELRRAANAHANVIGITKPFIYRDLELYSELQWGYAGYHHNIFRKFRPDLYRDDPLAVGEDFDTSLLHVSVSYGCLRRLDRLKTPAVDTSAIRPIDIHFRGTTNYQKGGSGFPPGTAYREACINAILAIAGRKSVTSAARDVALTAYFDELLTTKLCVSPWGWAVACHRDYEAILCGCRLVKPPSSHIMGFPDIYLPDPWYRSCAADFSDLHIAVELELSAWDDNALTRSTLRDRVIKESSKEAVATHIASVIHKCMERIPA